MTETFDREAIQRVRANLEHFKKATNQWPMEWPESDHYAAFLAHYDAMAAALEHSADLLVETWGYIMPGEPEKEIAVINARAVLEAYASQKDPGK